MVLLYSGQQSNYSGAMSLLACGVQEEISANNFAALGSRLSTHRPPFDNAWFGYLGYGLKHDVEYLPADERGPTHLPDLWFARFRHIYQFDHTRRQLVCWGNTPPSLPQIRAQTMPRLHVQQLSSNFTRATYEHAVQQVIDAIHAGDLYQANLTRKFWGDFTATPNSFALFEQLCSASPSPYSAYMRFGNTAIISSSPERFLTMDAGGHVTVRPIKGSAPRGKDAEEDIRLREQLEKSEKDRAENLMIVDLMRNDLSRSCEAGSVRVEGLFDVTTHPLVHHLSSTVIGQRKAGTSPLDVVSACFPPGSMTGAPKLRAIQMCTRLEKLQRGAYSGAIGWFAGDGSVDLSVIIRTLVVQDNRFEFQVGGGVVADSTPEGEWYEALIKARGICRMLGITEKQLIDI